MRAEDPLETKSRTSKFADQNQPPKKPNSNNGSKLRSSWGSHIVKGFTAEKKAKAQNPAKKLPETKNPLVQIQPRVKRSLITDLSCSVTTTTQVHPHSYNHRRNSSGSRDLFLELDHLRSLLQESKEREFKLQGEVSDLKRNQRVLELENEVDELSDRIRVLESEKSVLCEQVAEMCFVSEKKNEDDNGNGNLEMEVVELRRLNKELQMGKRNLAFRLSSMETQLASVAKASESEIVAKVKAEASLLRLTNEDLSKQVEGLQISRLNEVEELAYLRWVNSCLRDELQNSDKASAESSSLNEYSESSRSAKRLNLIRKLKKWPLNSDGLATIESTEKSWLQIEENRSPRRRHSISGSKLGIEEMLSNKRRQSDGFICAKELDKESEIVLTCPMDQTSYIDLNNNNNNSKLVSCFDVGKRALRVPNPPPRPSCLIPTVLKEESSGQVPPPPPPPPPPPKLAAVRSNAAGVVQRAPQVVEFYHSLMKRDSRKEASNGGVCDASEVANVRSNMIGEIENRSSHLLAIKADVETQGEFVNSLIREVNNAVYQNIEDVVEFVKWLDDELGFLVDERAVLKHFEWPEKKADTMREAAFGYRDLNKLESEVCFFKDDLGLPCDLALKKMVALSEKMERTVYNLLRTREFLMRNCSEFHIPTDWMLDNGIISKIKFGSVKLAKKYMKRVATEIQTKAGGIEKDPALDYMLLQGVRFAFRIHQFAGGFDSETMHAFEELRNLARLLNTNK